MTNEKVAEARERIKQLNTLFAELADEGIRVEINRVGRTFVGQKAEGTYLEATFVQVIR